MYKFVWCSMFWAAAVTTIFAIPEDLVVNTIYGPVRGHCLTSYEGNPVIGFEGIPYAKQPVDELRFKEPQPPDPWEEVFEANTTLTCLQYNILSLTGGVSGQEDCLSVNVYIPKLCIVPGELLPVVVHIHAGALSVGSPQDWGAYDYLMDKCLIYVSMTYRLGVLGFLSTQDDACPGNNGLKDQVLAMKWTKQNIRRFGGNPDSITLTGFSAGSTSVHLHYLSPLSKGLYIRGIAHSGTALETFALANKPLENAKKMAELFNCSTEPSTEMVECLRNQPEDDVVGAMSNFYSFINLLPITPFAPVIVHGNPRAFLTDHPYKLIMEGRINDHPLLFSNVENEGLFISGFVYLYNQLEYLYQHWRELFPIILNYNYTATDQDTLAISKAVKHRYFSNRDLSSDNGQNLTDLYTDRLFYIDGIKAIHAHAKNSRSPIHYYRYNYPVQSSTFFKGDLIGVAHGDDTRFIYKRIDNPPVLPDIDNQMKDVLTTFLYNYARYGVLKVNEQTWAPVQASGMTNHLLIHSPTDIERKNNVNLEPLKFWGKLPLYEIENVYYCDRKLEHKSCCILSIRFNYIIWSYQNSCRLPHDNDVCSLR